MGVMQLQSVGGQIQRPVARRVPGYCRPGASPRPLGRSHGRSLRQPLPLAAGGGAGEQDAVVELGLPLERQQGLAAAGSGRPSGVEGPGQGKLQPGHVLQGKYTVQDVLGAGSNATTYRASSSDGKAVAIKALSMKGMKDWKQLDLFQREAQVLASLQHPSIPRYIDYFEQDDDSGLSFYIVQEVVAGKSLAQMVNEGMRASDDQAVRIASELLQVLEYLGSLRPAVVHRDVKPENIVLEGGSWDGRPFLVDFGGVQGVAADVSSLGSTVIGTYGYMAPEQFRGSAQTASDLYALGATLLFLLTGRAPFSFPQERMRLQWKDAVQFPDSSRWTQLLDGLLEPVAEDRLTAKQALSVLRGEPVYGRVPAAVAAPSAAQLQALSPPRNSAEAWRRMQAGLTKPGVTVSKPAGTRVQLERSPTRLDITVPPKGLNMDTGFTGAFAVAWNAFVAVWTFSAVASGGILFALFSIPFWFAGAQLGRQALVGALMRERFAVGLNKFRLAQELALFSKDGSTDFTGGNNEKTIEGSTTQLLGARIVTTMIVNDQPQTAIEIMEGVKKHRFGEGLELAEQQWLASEINAQLEAMKGQPIDYSSFPEPDAPQTYRDDNSPAAEP